jgi:hypothetical protein
VRITLRRLHGRRGGASVKGALHRAMNE